MALGFDESQVDLYTMDSQYSLGNGVIVQVTGALGYKVGQWQPATSLFTGFCEPERCHVTG